MNKEQAIEYVRETFDDEEPDEEKLEQAFRAIYEREPDADDRNNGLWSLICSQVSHCGCSTRSEHDRKITVARIWDAGTSSEVSHDAHVDTLTVIKSGGCPVKSLLSSVDWDQELEPLAAEILGEWSDGYDGDPADSGLTVEVVRAGETATIRAE